MNSSNIPSLNNSVSNIEQNNHLPSMHESAMWFVPNFIEKKSNKLERVDEEVINKDEITNEIKEFSSKEIAKYFKDINLQFREMQLKLDQEILQIKNENLILRQQVTELKENFTDLKLKHSQLLDEREKNRLIRANVPFSFFPSK